MFSNVFQSGFISVFYSVGSSPLQIWDKSVKNGHIRRIIDDEVKSLVLEISGTNVATTYITCPIKPRASLGVRLPFLVMVVKNLKKYFTFEIQILDDKDIRRRFRVSNFQSTTKVRPFCTTMPIGLSPGWNQIQFNLADFTRRAYGSLYLETVRVQIHANVRIRRIYFSDRLYSEDELPSEYRLFVPISETKAKGKVKPKDSKAAKPVAAKPEEKAPIEPAEEPIPSGAPPSPTETQHSEPLLQTPSEPVDSTEAEAGDMPADIKEDMEAMESPVEGEGPTEGEGAESQAVSDAEAAPVEDGELATEGDISAIPVDEVPEDVVTTDMSEPEVEG